MGQSWCQPGPQPGDDGVGFHSAGDGEQGAVVGLMLAHHDRMVDPAEQGVLDDPLEVRSLLLDDDHLDETGGELANLVHVEGYGHGDLEQPDPGRAEVVVGVKPQDAQGFDRLLVGVATGDDADPVVGAAHRDGVEMVEHPVDAGEDQPHLVELALAVEGVRREQLPGGVRRPQPAVDLHRGDRGVDPLGMELHRPGAVGQGLDDLDAGPHPAGPREGDGMTAEVDGLLNVTGVDDRHVQVHQGGAARRGQGAALGHRIVAHQRDRAALGRRAGEHGVT